MKWFTPTIQDGFENVWTRKASPLPYWDHADPSAVQFVHDNKPVMIQSSFVLNRYPALRADLWEYATTSFVFSYKCHDRMHDQIVWYKPGAFARAVRIMELFQTKWNDPAEASSHAELGWLLGYPVEEIVKFVQDGIDNGDYKDR